MKALHWRGSVKEWGERKEGRKRKELNRKPMKKENRRKPEGIKYDRLQDSIKFAIHAKLNRLIIQ